MQNVRGILQERSSHTNTMPEIRGFHHFVPLNSSVIAAKRVSQDKKFTLRLDLVLGSISERVAKLVISDFIICLYDGSYWEMLK